VADQRCDSTNDVRTTFDALVGQLDYPMFIVTAATDDERAGCLVGFATQTSIDPSRFLVCLSKNNRTHHVARAAGVLAVHLVPDDGDALAELFGGKTGDRVDKFAQCDWRPGPAGVPILVRCESWFAGRVLGRLDAGDHDAFVLAPIAAATGGDRGEFSSRRASSIQPGHPS
jgi:flavin reductase (DIM6/NTAB) family NADH-FMN oxidoreductase RutF